MERSATWVFTINNYTDCDVARLESLDKEKFFTVFGEEVGEKGTPHLQGYIRADLRIRRAQVEKVLGGHAWCAVTHDEQSAIGYSIKDGRIHCNQECGWMVEVIRKAKEYGGEYKWLGSVWYNGETSPNYEPCRAYYNAWRYNERTQ